MEQKCESFLEQALFETSTKQPLIIVLSETYGLASTIKITCLTCQKQVAKLESARSNNDDDVEYHGEIKKKSETLCNQPAVYSWFSRSRNGTW